MKKNEDIIVSCQYNARTIYLMSTKASIDRRFNYMEANYIVLLGGSVECEGYELALLKITSLRCKKRLSKKYLSWYINYLIKYNNCGISGLQLHFTIYPLRLTKYLTNPSEKREIEKAARFLLERYKKHMPWWTRIF